MKKLFVVAAVIMLSAVSCKKADFMKSSEGDTVDVVKTDTATVVKDTVVTVDTLNK